MESLWRRRSTVVSLLVAFVPTWTGWSIYQALDLDRRSGLGETRFLFGWWCSIAGFVAWYAGFRAHPPERALRDPSPLDLNLFAAPSRPTFAASPSTTPWLAVFALAATALAIVTGVRSFTRATTIDPIFAAPERVCN